MAGRPYRTMAAGIVFLTLAIRSLAALDWDGEKWADYSAFMTPLAPELKARCRAILQSDAGKKRTPGRMGQFGDSITAANSYFRKQMVQGITDNETGHDYKPIRAWLHGSPPPNDDTNWYHNFGKLEDFGNRGGWTVREAVKGGHPRHALDTGGAYASKPPAVTPGNFSWAIVMFGTNDMRTPDWDPVAWKREYKAFLQGCIDQGCIPVISTIPPQHENMANGKVAQVNRIVNQLAQELQIPQVDFYGLILHTQPGDAWDGKAHGENRLISADGTHPKIDSTYALKFSKAALTFDNGYGARTKLAFDMAERIKAVVFADGPAETGWLALDPAAARTGLAGIAGKPFTAALHAQHAVGKVAWSLSDGKLPAGLSLSADGTLTGSPTETGIFSVTMKAADEARFAEMEIVISINMGTPPKPADPPPSNASN